MARSPDVLAHWHVLVDDFNTSALDYYLVVQSKLEERQVPDITFSHVHWNEGGLVSARREYLRVRRGRLTYDICAAPYGSGYFFSSWMALQRPNMALMFGCGGLLALPVLWTICLKMMGAVGGTMLFLALLVLGVVMLNSSISTGASEAAELIAALPVVGPVFVWAFKPTTYFSEDTRLMFQTSVQRAVREAIDEIRGGQGLRALSPEEGQETMRNLLR